MSWSGVLWRLDPRITQGNSIIQQIEKFKSTRGRIPEGLYELGLTVTEEGPLYYEKRSDEYILYFNVGFDDTYTYYSKSKKWEDFYVFD